MAGFDEKLLLAFVAFLLGLLADVIKRAFQRERKRIIYAIARRSIVATTSTLPEDVRAKMPDLSPINLSEYAITLQNAGTSAVTDGTVLISFGGTADIIHSGIQTSPEREVNTGTTELPTKGELRLKSFTLEKKHRIVVTAFVRSPDEPQVAVYGSGGGGDVQWLAGGPTQALGIEGHAVAAIKYFFVAQIVSPVLAGISFLLVSLLSSDQFDSKWQIGSAVVGQTIGSLISLYFYLRIVPHALAIVSELSEKFRGRMLKAG